MAAKKAGKGKKKVAKKKIAKKGKKKAAKLKYRIKTRLQKITSFNEIVYTHKNKSLKSFILS